MENIKKSDKLHIYTYSRPLGNEEVKICFVLEYKIGNNDSITILWSVKVNDMMPSTNRC